MKRKLSLKTRLMVTTSLLLIIISIIFTFFSMFNAYFNIINPYLEQKNIIYGQEAVEFINNDTDITVNGNNFFKANILFMLIASIIGCSLTYLVAKFSLKPLKNWSIEIENINQEQLSKRIQKPNTKDELDVLANSFNQLLYRLQMAFDREKRFSSAVAHELKTPLTVVKTNIEFLQTAGNQKNEDYEETIEVIKKQNERMIQLVQDLMFLSSSNVQERNEFINIDMIISEIENDLKSLLLSKNIKFEYNKIGFKTKGNVVLMKHALSNLIENAIKYNITNGKIIISQKIEKEYYKIIISDSGIGINEEDVPYIFEPFYRADKSRNRKAGGSGLGLAITKEIIESHNGKIEYHTREIQGSQFVIYLPII